MQTGSRQTVARAVGAIVGGFLWLGLIAPPPSDGGQAPPPAEIVVSSRVDKVRLTDEEPLTFSVTIAGPIRTAPRVSLSSLEGFQVISTGQSQQTTIRGGRMQLAVTLHYVLAPTAPGHYTLGPVVVEHAGKRYETAPIQVEVVATDRRRPVPKPAPRRPPVRGGTIL